MEIYDGYGILGEVTYAAVWEVQQYANDPDMTPVRDAAGFYRQDYGSGDFYPIDELTYAYIMVNLPYKP